MKLTPSGGARTDSGGGRTLIVADWAADPRAVVLACAEHARDASLSLVVPSMLHGIDWVGDPYANVPCAKHALSEMSSLLKAANLSIQSADLGDHDSLAAVIDVTLRQSVDRIVVCEPSHRLRPRLIDLAHRARRATGLPVTHVAVAPTERTRTRAPWFRLWRGECPATRPPSSATAAISV